jgi:hypothetical protein
MADAVGVEVQAWQGLGLEHHSQAADVPGKESGGGAHRGWQSTARRGGGTWQGPRWSEGRRRLQLALGAAGEDERGEGGLK